MDEDIAAREMGEATLVPWQGDPGNMIDRFDARASLDIIEDVERLSNAALSTEEYQPLKYRLILFGSDCCQSFEAFKDIVLACAIGISEEDHVERVRRLCEDAIADQLAETRSKSYRAPLPSSTPTAPKAAIGYTYNEGAVVGERSQAEESLAVAPVNIGDELDLEEGKQPSRTNYFNLPRQSYLKV